MKSQYNYFSFWEKIYNLKSNNLEFTLKLKHLIFGYKISDNNYYGVNYFITILGFSIYKSYKTEDKKCKCLYNFYISTKVTSIIIHNFPLK
jgi:hypothetical protein